MARQRDLIDRIQKLAAPIVDGLVANAALGGVQAQAALLPYIIPKATLQGVAISTEIVIDISTADAAKASMNRIASAMGNREIGLQEGNVMLDAIGKALDRISTADMGEIMSRLEDLERAPNQSLLIAGAARQPVSHANGSTPLWGNMLQHPSIAHASDAETADDDGDEETDD